MQTEASRSLKWLYYLILIVTIFPSGLLGASGWVGLATGGGIFRGGLIGLAILFAIFIYRIVLVARFHHAQQFRW